MSEATNTDVRVSETDPETTTICCRGGSGALGHPAVYLYLGKGVEEVTCYYCGRVFKRSK